MTKSILAPMSGRFVVVTGGGRGIGKAIALDLAEKGAAGIAITYAGNKQAADEVIAQLKHLGCQNVTAIKADTSESDFGEKIVQAALTELHTDKLHVIINNAGYMGFDMSTTFEQDTLENFDKNMHGNVWGPLLLIKAALPHIASTGRIINISSAASRSANMDPLMFYGAAKAALDSMTRSLAKKYAPLKKITINSVSVGATRTETAAEMFKQNPAVEEMMSQLASAERRVAETKDIANIVSFLASEESRWVNGHNMMADGGSQLERQG